MYAKVLSSTILGIDAYSVTVEAHLEHSYPLKFFTVGLPEGAVKESKERVLAALKNSDYNVPQLRYVINLAPADIRKEGSGFDLPIAIGILAAQGIIDKKFLDRIFMVGELSLDGRLQPVKGILPICMHVQDQKGAAVIVPEANLKEASFIEGLRVAGCKNLRDVVSILNGDKKLSADASKKPKIARDLGNYTFDFSDVKGQQNVKRAFEVAASGGHNILLIGPPGSGKTMLAKRLPTILPSLSMKEALETTKIHSVAGLNNLERGIVSVRPFSSPHHTISDVGLIGGGPFPKPGEVSLAHNGVLFLDELPEFKKTVLEVMRQPLENREVTITRARHSLTYPANFMLVAAMNPCPCGYYTDKSHQCTCELPAIQKYLARISGPLLDRIDIHIDVPAVPFEQLADEKPSEDSANIRKRIMAAREIQSKRFAHAPIHSNANMEKAEINEYCKLEKASLQLLKTAMDKLGLSARAYDRILKVARTIADLANSHEIQSAHLSEAIQYRTMDRNIWRN